MKLVELLKNAQKSRLQLLLIGLEEKEYFSKLEKAGKNGSLFIIVCEQADLEYGIFSFSKEMTWEDALKELNYLKKDVLKQNGYFIYNEHPIGFCYATDDIDIHEYNIKTVEQAKNFAQNLYKAGAIDNTPPKGWTKQICLN